MRPFTRRSLLTLFAGALLLPAFELEAQREQRRQFVYLLRVNKPYHEASAWTARESDAVRRHFERLLSATATGQVILAGRTVEALPETFGVVIFEADTVDAAREFMQADPAVVAGVMSATLHPYSVALLRRPRAE